MDSSKKDFSIPEQQRISLRSDYHKPGAQGVRKIVVGRSTRLDFIPARQKKLAVAETNEEGSSPSETGGKLYPHSSVVEEAFGLSARAAGEFLISVGYSEEDLKNRFRTRGPRRREVAIQMARVRNLWQQEAPEGWTGDAIGSDEE